MNAKFASAFDPEHLNFAMLGRNQRLPQMQMQMPSAERILAFLQTARPIKYDGIQYKSGTCGPKAADVFLGVEGDKSTRFTFTCDTSENLCKCLVDVGDNSKTVVFQSDTPEDTLTLQGDGTSVRYWFGGENRRRRLLGSRTGGRS